MIRPWGLLALVAVAGCALIDAVGGPSSELPADSFDTQVGERRFRRLVAGQFGGDLQPDLVAIDEDGAVTVITASAGPERRFEPHGTSTRIGFVGDAPDRQPQDLATGDFNGDSFLDLAVIDGSNGVSLLYGRDLSQLSELTPLFSRQRVSISLVVRGDFDGDSLDDLAFFTRSPNELYVYLNRGSDLQAVKPSLFEFDVPQIAAASDFTGDARDDLLVDGSGAMHLLVSQGDGTFREQPAPGGSFNPQAVASGDFDRDSRSDYALANAGAGNPSFIRVVFQRGPGPGSFTAELDVGSGTTGPVLLGGDWDQDGALDLARIEGTGGRSHALTFYTNHGGAFEERGQLDDGGITNAAAAADFTGDGRSDVAVGWYDQPGVIRVYSLR
jgi:hypothetical protein